MTPDHIWLGASRASAPSPHSPRPSMPRGASPLLMTRTTAPCARQDLLFRDDARQAIFMEGGVVIEFVVEREIAGPPGEVFAYVVDATKLGLGRGTSSLRSRIRPDGAWDEDPRSASRAGRHTDRDGCRGCRVRAGSRVRATDRRGATNPRPPTRDQTSGQPSALGQTDCGDAAQQAGFALSVSRIRGASSPVRQLSQAHASAIRLPWQERTSRGA